MSIFFNRNNRPSSSSATDKFFKEMAKESDVLNETLRELSNIKTQSRSFKTQKEYSHAHASKLKTKQEYSKASNSKSVITNSTSSNFQEIEPNRMHILYLDLLKGDFSGVYLEGTVSIILPNSLLKDFPNSYLLVAKVVQKHVDKHILKDYVTSFRALELRVPQKSDIVVLDYENNLEDARFLFRLLYQQILESLGDSPSNIDNPKNSLRDFF